MIKNYNLASRNFASENNLAPIKEFRKETAHSREIFESFADTGKKIVHLKKKEEKGTLSTKAEAVLEKLQKKAERIVQKIDEIMKNSDYSARDVLAAGYPMLASGKYADWIFGKEPEDENEDEDEKALIALMNEDADKEPLKGQPKETHNSHADQAPSKAKTSEQVTPAQVVAEAPKAEQKLEKEIAKYEPTFEITHAERTDNSVIGKVKLFFKETVNFLTKPGALSELWQGLKAFLPIIGEFACFDGAFFLIEECKYISEVLDRINKGYNTYEQISKDCWKNATRGLKKKSLAGKLWVPSRAKIFFRKYITPLLIKGSIKFKSQWAVLLGKGLGKALSIAMIVQLSVFLIENLMQAFHNMKSETVSSGAQLKSIKNSINIVMRQFGTAFKYLNFNTGNFDKNSLGIKSFMHYTEYEPLAYYLNEQEKPEGMLYLSVYDPSRYKAGGNAEEEHLPKEFRSSFTTSMKSDETKNLISLWLVPNSGEPILFLTAYNALPIFGEWIKKIMKNSDSINILRDANIVTETSKIAFTGKAAGFEYLLECDPRKLDDKAQITLSNASIMKNILSKIPLFVSQCCQFLINFVSNASRKILDGEAYNEGRDDFYVSGTLDPFAVVAGLGSFATSKTGLTDGQNWNELANSWTPFFTGGKRVKRKENDKERQTPALPAKGSDK